MAYLSTGVGNTGTGSSYLDNVRRIYNFGDRVARLRPQETLFFSYLSGLAKQPTDDSKFMFLEQRDQWQRRNVVVAETVSAGNIADGGTVNVKFAATYDNFGRDLGGMPAAGTPTTGVQYARPVFLLANQRLAVKCGTGTNAGVHVFLVTAVANSTATSFGGGAGTVNTVTATLKNVSGSTINVGFVAPVYSTATEGNKGQIVGTAFAEATGAPDGFEDQLYDREGYTQIFKTAVNVVSGSAMATRYRGIPNEWARIWGPKMMEHKMDISHALLFGVGSYAAEDGTNPKRYTWGIKPYVDTYGVTQSFTYASSGYNDFMDFMQTFLAPEKGSQGKKMILTSRNILGWMNKLADEGFLKNSVGANPILNYETINGRFGHKLTQVNTIWGDLVFGEEVLLRGIWEDVAIVIDMDNVKYRPLVGNGVNRDTHVITNVQDNDVDGRKDMILTEAGLQIDLPETHAVLTWS